MLTGYKQELRRDFNLFTNSAISFSIISILTGITSESFCLSPDLILHAGLRASKQKYVLLP